MRIKIHKFTLVELLVVLAIFTILITILLPGLTKARHKTTNIICLNNMRQQGVATLAYTVDNSQKYISTSYDPMGNQYNDRWYIGNPHLRLTKETSLLMDYMSFNQYNRYSKEAAQMMACPFTFEEYYKGFESITWMKDSDGDGILEEERRFPLGNVYGITSYQNYSAFYQFRWGVVKRPMIRVGDTIEYGNWANAASSPESRILMSDTSGAYKGQKNLWVSSHPIIPGSRNSYGSDGDPMIKNNFYWRSYTQAGYVTNNYYSSNYLYDDLSVKVRNRLNESNTAVGSHVVTLPLDSFE